MIKIRFDGEVPDEVQAAIAPLIDKWLWLLPTWVHLLYVQFTEHEASLSTSCDEEYRKVRLYIHAGWLVASPEIRDSNVCHEFIHVLTDPLFQFGGQVCDVLEKDSALHKWAREQLRLAVERSTVDLEYAIRHHQA